MSGHLAHYGKHTLKARRDDLVETPPEAVTALLSVEDLPAVIWEPACGPGALARVLRTHGHTVIATDLVPYGPDQDGARIDFLMELKAPPGCECIVTNPPYKLLDEFVRHALWLCPRVIMLMELSRYGAICRNDILDGGQLARIHVFRNRLVMHRYGWTGRKDSPPRIHGWFVWDRAHRGPTTIDRISWERAP